MNARERFAGYQREQIARWATSDDRLIAGLYDNLRKMRPDATVALGFPDVRRQRVLFVFIEGGRPFMGSFSLSEDQEPVMAVEDNELPFTSAADFLDRLHRVRQSAGASQGEVFVDEFGSKARVDDPHELRNVLEQAGMVV